MDDERTPLLDDREAYDGPADRHLQFCKLVGVTPSDLSAQAREHYPRPGSHTLYERARRKRRSTQITNAATTALSNTLLLSQVVLGAALTALGASASSHVLIAIFGAANTVIAGLIAYLKSRGQPMRSRMFKDDLERVVEEIENSEIMWLGISRKMHGYDDIDTDDDVSVRSEVARLTRLYDRALRNNTLNNPDAYMNGQNGSEPYPNLRARPGQSAFPALTAAVVPAESQAAAGTSVAPTIPAPSTGPAPRKESGAGDTALGSRKPSPDPESTPAAGKRGLENGVSKSTDDGFQQAPLPNSGKEDAAASVAPVPAPSPSPNPTPASATEPPAGVPLGADIDEGPVTAPSKKKEKE